MKNILNLTTILSIFGFITSAHGMQAIYDAEGITAPTAQIVTNTTTSGTNSKEMTFERFTKEMVPHMQDITNTKINFIIGTYDNNKTLSIKPDTCCEEAIYGINELAQQLGRGGGIISTIVDDILSFPINRDNIDNFIKVLKLSTTDTQPYITLLCGSDYTTSNNLYGELKGKNYVYEGWPSGHSPIDCIWHYMKICFPILKDCNMLYNSNAGMDITISNQNQATLLHKAMKEDGIQGVTYINNVLSLDGEDLKKIAKNVLDFSQKDIDDYMQFMY